MMITEYGADAYDNTNQREWQNDEQNLGLQAGHGWKYWPGCVDILTPGQRARQKFTQARSP